MANSTLRTKLFTSTVSLIAMVAAGTVLTPANAFALDAGALPENGNVVGGSASFDYSQPNKLNVNQSTDRVVINWDSFNIGTDATTQFYQPNSNSLAVNRVQAKGTDPTQILGKLIANGKVMVLDRNGVIFGKNSVVDVGGIIASSGDVSTAAVMNGDNKIDISNLGDGAIINNGTISAADAGLVGFVGKTAINNGVINAKLGRVALASGEKTTIDLNGDGLIEIAADSNLEKAIVSNTGTINAEGGTVQLTASAAKNAVDNVVNMDGIVNVSSVSVRGGKIILGAGKGTAKVSGKLKASGTAGGDVKITGNNVIVSDNAEISADGSEGKGGNALIFGDNVAIFNGTLSARGKTKGGDAEISAVEGVGFNGLVDLSSEIGDNGTLLIDPKTLNISSNPTSGVIADILSGGTGTVNVNDQAIANTLRFSNVNLWATQDLNVTSDIDVSTWNGLFGSKGITSRNLTLAAPTINISNDVVIGNGQFNLYNLPAGSAVAFGLMNVPAAGINVNVVNLDAVISKRSTVGGALSVAGDSQLNSQANTVNVLSDAALIQQGIYLVKDSGGTVNVAAGNYTGGINVDKSVTLNGTGAGYSSVVNAPNFGNGFRVTGDNVNINGFGITGFNTAIGINLSGADNAVITNNSIDKIGQGVFGTGSENATVTNNRVSNASVAGIRLLNALGATISGNILKFMPTAISIDGVDNAQISTNRIFDVATGISLNNAEGSSTVQKNTIDGATTVGIVAKNSASVLIGSPTISNVVLDAAIGIQSINNDDVRITRNRVNNGGTGYSVINSDSAWVDHNIAEGQTGNGFEVSGSTGVRIDSNRAAEVGGNGFNISGGTDSLIQNNRAYLTGDNAFRISGATNGVIINNFAGSDNDGISKGVDNVQGDGFNITTSNGAQIHGNRVTQATGAGIRVSDSSNMKIGKEVLADSSIFSNKISSTTDGIVVVGGTNIEILKNQVNDTTGAGISVSGVVGTDDTDNLRIMRNHVRTGNDGIVISGSDYARVRSNVVQDMSGDGIDVSSSASGKIISNRVFNIDGTGILVDGLAGGLVSNNRVYLTGGDAYNISNAANSFIINNFAGSDSNGISKGTDNVQGDGFDISSSDGVAVYSNRVQQVTGAGIRVSSSDNALIGKENLADSGEWSNEISFANDGIVVENSANVSVIKNLIDHIDGVAIRAGNAFNALIRRNNINFAGTGVFVGGAGSVEISSNSMHNIVNDGIDVTESNGVEILSNRVYDVGGDGINISESNNALIRFNSAYLTGGDAFDVSSSSNVRVLNNFAGSFQNGPSQGAGNIDNGYVFGNVSGLQFSNNRSIDAAQNGLILASVDETTVNANTIINSGLNGLYARGPFNGTVVLTGNTFTDNTVGARFESGLIDLTGTSNSFTGGSVGLLFSGALFEGETPVEEELPPEEEVPPFEEAFFKVAIVKEAIKSLVVPFGGLALVNDTISTSVFTGQTQYFVQLENGALFNPGAPTDLDGAFATYNGYNPSVDGLLMSQAQFDLIENGIFHFSDENTLGRFFFGSVPVAVGAGIDTGDIFREISGIPGTSGRFSITIQGLPRLPGVAGGAAGGAAPLNFALNNITPAAGGGAASLNNITPAAGDEVGGNAASNPQSVEPAAGADDGATAQGSVSCWGDAVAAASSGQAVTYSFGTDGGTDALAAASCSNPS